MLFYSSASVLYPNCIRQVFDWDSSAYYDISVSDTRTTGRAKLIVTFIYLGYLSLYLGLLVAPGIETKISMKITRTVTDQGRKHGGKM